MKMGRPKNAEPRSDTIKVSVVLDRETFDMLEELTAKEPKLRGGRSTVLRRLIGAAFWDSSRK